MPSNHWSNRLSFIITTSAFAVGLGNIWRFPYIAGEGGGGAFLLVYFILVLLIGIPLLTVEMGLGRMSKTTPLLGFGKLSGKKEWNAVGWMALLANLLIMCYYVMILAWILIYFAESLSGNIYQLEAEELPVHFSMVAGSLGEVIAVVTGIMVLALIIVAQGLKTGLERVSKTLMIGLLLMLLGLTAWAATLEGAAAGYRWYLRPDFSKINGQVIITALGQMCFSVGVGMGIAFAFGSYADREDKLVSSVGWIVFADTILAFLAGLMIFPAIFTFGLSPDAGPNLIFITMASVFSQLAYGKWVGALFFLLLFFAGFTSLIASIQGLKDSFQDKFGLPFRPALLLVTGLIALGAIPVVFSYSEYPLMLFGLSYFDFLDHLTNNIMLPLGAFFLAIFGAYILGYRQLIQHIDQGAGRLKIGNKWWFILKWLIPLVLLIIFINGIFF